MMTTSIEWGDFPRFELISNGGMWDRFRCISGGEVRLNGDRVLFKEGWETDFTSSPGWARSLVAQLGPYAPAVIIHDKLLDEGVPRWIARFWLDAQLCMLTKVSKQLRCRISRGVWLNDMKLRIFEGVK